MATDATGTRSVYNTLSTTVVDTVTLQGHWLSVDISNREAAGGASIWVTLGFADHVPADPVALANETFEVPAGTVLTIPLINDTYAQPCIKLVGSGNAYGIVGNPQ